MRAPTATRWIVTVAGAELVGFALTGSIAFLGLALGGHPTTVTGRVLALLVMTFAGLIEGGCYGGAQALLLRRWLPGLPWRRFVGATMALAAGAWCFGMSMPLIATVMGSAAQQREAPVEGPPTWLVMLFAIGFGAVAGALFGVVQLPALRGLVARRGAWVAGSAAGWGAGLPWAYLAGSLGSPDMPWWQAGALVAGAGLAMGLCAGAGTFVALRRLEPT